METKTLTKSDLDQFTGTEHYYPHWTGRMKATDGVEYVAEVGECFWLIDIIASYQHEPQVKREEFQVWELKKQEHAPELFKDKYCSVLERKVTSDDMAVVQATDGNGNVIAEQFVPYTDFPLDEIKMFLTNDVLMLPSEY